MTQLKSFVPADPQDPAGWSSNLLGNLVAAGNKLYFTLNVNDGTHCCTLWMSDSTPQGTVAVKTFDPKTVANHDVEQLTPVGDQVFFVAEGFGAKGVSTGNELWVSDGTSGGTHLVKAIAMAPRELESKESHGLSALGRSLLFFQLSPTAAGHVELWKSDGTPPGTVRIKDLGANSTLGVSLVAGNTLYFASSDPAHGEELWKSDGTEAGTQLVKDLVPGADSSKLSDFKTDGTSLYFTATVSAHKALWRSNGSEAGTVLISALDPDATEGPMTPMALVGHALYLNALNKNDHLLRLYRIDLGGSGAAQRQLVATLPNSNAQNAAGAGDPSIWSFTASGDKLYFAQRIPSGHPAPQDVQLWVTDGTQAGTQLLMHPMNLSDEFVESMAAVGNRVVTTGYSADGDGLEPWVSDGTVAGTRELKDIAPGKGASFPTSFTPVGNAMYFVAYDLQSGNSLWVFKPGS